MRSAIQRNQFLPVQLESDSHYRTFRAGTRYTVTSDVEDPGILEDGDVEVRCLFTLGVEPQPWRDLLHYLPLSTARLLRLSGLLSHREETLPGMASFAATSLNRAPVGSAAAARRPYGVSSAAIRMEPPRSTTFASAASVSSTPKYTDQWAGTPPSGR